MAFKRKVKVKIHGAAFTVVSELPEQTITSMAREVEDNIVRLEKSIPEISTFMAAVMTALSYCQSLRTAELGASGQAEREDDFAQRMKIAREDADNARNQLIVVQEQLHEATRKNEQLKGELDAARREAKAANLLAESAVNDLKMANLEVDSYNMQTEEALAEMEKSEQKIKDISAELVSKTEQIENMSRQMEKLNADIEKLHEENTKVLEENKELNAKLEDAQDEIATLKKKKYFFKR